jgi:PPM family protein phosphatase
MQGPRKYNQDRIAYTYSKESLLAIVADGLGGHHHGEIAAQMAVTILTDSLRELALPTLADPFNFLLQNICKIHDAITSHVAANHMPDSPRTTIVAAIAQSDCLYCAHVGDSRLYHIRDGRLLFRTEDHSKVQMMFRKGIISKAEMVNHAERNKIYNCIGGEHPPQVDMAQERALREGDTVLLCTDGLWALVDDYELAEILQNGPATDTLPVLMGLAESRADMTSDNMSAIAFNWGERAYDSLSLSTATMPLDITAASIKYSSENMGQSVLSSDTDTTLSDEEIESTITEIQEAIKKNHK